MVDEVCRAADGAADAAGVPPPPPPKKKKVAQLELQTGGFIDRENLQQIGLMGLPDAALRRYGTPDEKLWRMPRCACEARLFDELPRSSGVFAWFVSRRTGARGLAPQLSRQLANAVATLCVS